MEILQQKSAMSRRLSALLIQLHILTEQMQQKVSAVNTSLNRHMDRE